MLRRVLWRRMELSGFPHVMTAALQRYAEKTSDEVQGIGGRRRNGLYAVSALLLKGKLKVEVCTAVARELTGLLGLLQ